MTSLPLLRLLTAVPLFLPGSVGPGGQTEAAKPDPVGRLLFPGYAAFEAGHPPRLPAGLAKPLLRNGRLEPGYFLLHFRDAITPSDEAWLAGHAGLGPRANPWPVVGRAVGLWVADLGTLADLWRSPRVDWVGRYQPGYKLDPALVLDDLGEVPMRLEVELVPAHPPELVARELEELGAQLVAGVGASGLIVDALPRIVPRLARVEGILRLQEDDESEALSRRDELARAATLLGPRPPGGGGSRQGLVVPETVTLAVREGLHSNDGTLPATDLDRLRASDDNRFVLHDRAQLTLGFERAVPADASVKAIRLFVEHHEERHIFAGDVLWRLASGSLTSPIIVETTSAPLRSAETLDAWLPRGLVQDANELGVVIRNDSKHDDTILDRVYVEVDYTLSELAPHVTSTPSGRAIVDEPYLYDLDGRADASGTAPLAWSLVSGPAGFTIATSGVVSWTPRAAGSSAITIQVANSAGSELQSFAVEVLPLPSTLLPANTIPIVYLPPERLALGPEKPQQQLNVFLPRGTVPPAGWPVVLNNRAGGGVAAKPLASLHDTGGTAPLHAFLASGIAVVDFGVTGIENGQGLFYPPGHPSGRYESFAPADDDPEKDAEWAVQWLKTQGSFPLDTDRVCLRGSSHGAIISIWAAMGPERARASGSEQVRASTRVRAILALQPPTSVWAFDQGPGLAVRMLAHYEQQDLPGVPATAFGQVAESLQKDSSVMGFAFDTPEARAHDQTQAICLVYNDPVLQVGGAPADLSLDAQGFPNLHDALGQPFVHDSWAGYAFWRRLLGLSPRAAAFHRVFSRFAVRDTSALPPPFDVHTHVYSGGIRSAGANAVAHEWVLQALGVSPPPVDSGSGSETRKH